MAIDKLADLQEKKNGLSTEIKELGNRQEDWQAEDRERWDTLNAEYDGVVEEMEDEQQRADVAARLSNLEENVSPTRS